MKENKGKWLGCLVSALTIFVASPLDDIIIASVFGTTIFGFGTTGFYVLLIAGTAVSLLIWKKESLLKISLGKFWKRVAP